MTVLEDQFWRWRFLRMGFECSQESGKPPVAPDTPYKYLHSPADHRGVVIFTKPGDFSVFVNLETSLPDVG